MKRCPACRAQYPDDAKFCPIEGSSLVPVEGGATTSQIIGGKYRLGRVLGGERTGTVYEATHQDRPSEPCALKIIHPEIFPTSLLVSRAEREFKQMSTLASENVVKILDYGKHEDRLWIAMERAGEKPLSKVLHNKRLTESETLAVARQLMQALEDATKRGLVHRDLAPKNALVGEGDKLRVINFSMPIPGKPCVGVAEYLSPEQVKGRPADLRSNIYSLGAILFHCLEGRPIFEGDRDAVLKAHKESKAPALGSEVSQKFRDAISKSLEKNSSRRFMTLRQFSEALGAQSSGAGSETKAVSSDQGKASPDANQTLMGIAAPDAATLKAALDAKSKAELESKSDEAAAQGTPPPTEAAKASARAPARVSQPPPNPEKKSKKSKSKSKSKKGKDEKSAKDDATVKSSIGKDAKYGDSDAADTVVDEPKPDVANMSAEANAAKDLKAPKLAKANVAAPKIGSGPVTRGKKATKTPPPDEPADAPAKKGKFRETMWFKKGELDEAAAQAASVKREKDALVSDKADEMAMDVRYNDDGSISDKDKERLSLRTGSTLIEEPIENVMSRSRVSEAELVSELKGGRTKVIVGLGVAALLLIVVGFLLS